MANYFTASQAPKAVNPPSLKLPGIGGKVGGGMTLPKPKAAQQTHSVNDQFMLSDPYKPGTLQATAQGAYNADVANAQKLASMGTTPNAQIASDYAQRGTNVNNIYQGLAQQLAGIQTANVAQGNAGAAALAGQTAGLGAPAGVQAVLGANTAATGNYGGSLQAAALSAGAQNQKGVLDAGTIAQTTNDQNIQKTLASLLSGVSPVSTRVDNMRLENQKVDSANLQTRIGIYQNDETAKTAALAAGRKDLYDAANLKEQRDEAHWSNAEKIQAAKISQAGQTARTATTQAGLTARAKAKAKADALKQKSINDNKITTTLTKGIGGSTGSTTGSSSSTTASGKPIKGYNVSVKVPVTKTGKDALGNPTTTTTYPLKPKKFTATQWKAYLASGPEGKRNLSILGLPNGSKVIVNSKTAY